MPSHLTSALLFLCFYSTAFGESRSWTNDQNRTAEGELISATETHATIQFAGQKASREIDLQTLSAADQDYITEWRNSQNQKKEEPGSEAEEKNYNPKDNYRKRQKALQELTKDIPDNFDDAWPKLVKSPKEMVVTLVSEDAEKNEYVYHSDHYEFICDVPLKPHLVERFATLFEGTREFCRVLPISTKKAHVAGQTHRNRILLFETVDAYYQNGGLPGSSGVFRGGTDTVIVPLTSLGVKKVGSSYSIDYKEDNKTLPHELTHQLTDAVYYQLGSRGWFSEGLAEYIATTPYRSGNFLVTKTINSAKDYATEYGREGKGGRNLGEEIHAPSLKDYMLQDYGSFSGENANFNYGLGLLITTYFFHMDGKGDRVAITAFLKALREGKKGEEALALLRQGRSYNELADDISKGWRSKGIKISFRSTKE